MVETSCYLCCGEIQMEENCFIFIFLNKLLYIKTIIVHSISSIIHIIQQYEHAFLLINCISPSTLTGVCAPCRLNLTLL